MLSRTADSLYWLARYVERAEYLARNLDAAARLAALPASYGGGSDPWALAVEAAGVAEPFRRAYGEANEDTVRAFLAFSPENPSSIVSCLETARANARAVRTALTVEAWDAINGAWLDLRRYDAARTDREAFGRFLDFVKEASLRFDGSAYRTMLRGDAYWFSRLGVYVERADNTARLLDVKSNATLPEGEPEGGSLDYFQWAAILREVSALTAYHWVYRQSVKPRLVADLLVLNPAMPRSLASCNANAVRLLDELAQAYGTRGPAQRQARAVRSLLAETRVESFAGEGLHAFITRFVAENAELGAAVSAQYLA